MNRKIEIGNRVKLTAQGVKAFTRGYNRRSKIDWVRRRGTLLRANANFVYVIWDGNQCADQLPVQAIEPEDRPMPQLVDDTG